MTTADLWANERVLLAEGCRLIGGIDEAGRGPLAGPVVAACVILPVDFSPEGIDDSKKLTEAQRETAFERIERQALAVGVGLVSPEEIDRINILRATHLAMRLALETLGATPDALLVDGLPVPGLACERVLALVGGDGLSISIAAASIVAKVTRDRLMRERHSDFPLYRFDKNKGYSSAFHLAALAEHGPCPLHRRSFAPVGQCAFKW
ncbi:MAG TPA: ribonuclease HII [Capsulimonadaceae bacterium]|nr:ribonuclease HII [Capsulimonadaceae bacterium]